MSLFAWQLQNYIGGKTPAEIEKVLAELEPTLSALHFAALERVVEQGRRRRGPLPSVQSRVGRWA